MSSELRGELPPFIQHATPQPPASNKPLSSNSKGAFRRYDPKAEVPQFTSVIQKILNEKTDHSHRPLNGHLVSNLDTKRAPTPYLPDKFPIPTRKDLINVKLSTSETENPAPILTPSEDEAPNDDSPKASPINRAEVRAAARRRKAKQNPTLSDRTEQPTKRRRTDAGKTPLPSLFDLPLPPPLINIYTGQLYSPNSKAPEKP